jgi:prepilin-type N-terminal cleavage/methylation domain-containing protein
LFRSLLKEERGYTLIEVMVAIVVLTIAIIPMISMFDMSLKVATKGSDYDKARALANLKLEEAKSLPFSDVEDNYPMAAGDPETPHTYNGSGQYQSDWLTQPGAVFTNFEYRVTKQYMAKPSVAPTSASEPFRRCDEVTPSTCGDAVQELIRVTVTVGWGAYNPVTNTYSNSFTTYGLKAL